MKLFHVTIDSKLVLSTFSPVEVVECLLAATKKKGEIFVDVYMSEVK